MTLKEKQIFNRIVTFLLIFMVTSVTSLTVFANDLKEITQTAGTCTYHRNSDLGLAQYFGAFIEDTCTIEGDFESNVACTTLQFNSTIGNSCNGKGYTNTGGVNYAKHLLQTNMLHFRSSDLIVIGNEYKIEKDSNTYYVNGNKVEESANIKSILKEDSKIDYIDLSAEFTNLVNIAESWMSKDNTEGITYSDKGASGEIKCATGGAINYYKVNADVINKSIDGLSITTNTPIIINVDTTGCNNIVLQKTSVNGKNAGCNDKESTNKIIWNFGNYSGNISMIATVGTILAPKATVNNNATSVGRVIAKKFNSNAELHFLSDIPDLPSASPAVSPSVSPSTSPSVSPSTSPAVSPSTSPSVSPSTSPSVRPSTSPSVSPSVSPSTSPSVSPSTSPAVSPSTSPSVSPSTSPSTSPSVSPSTSPSVSPSTSPSVSPSTSTPSSYTSTPSTSYSTSTPTSTPIPMITPTPSPSITVEIVASPVPLAPVKPKKIVRIKATPTVEIEEKDQDIPLGSALPKTGTTPTEVYFAGGILLIALGIYIKKS